MTVHVVVDDDAEEHSKDGNGRSSNGDGPTAIGDAQAGGDGTHE